MDKIMNTRLGPVNDETGHGPNFICIGERVLALGGGSETIGIRCNSTRYSIIMITAFLGCLGGKYAFLWLESRQRSLQDRVWASRHNPCLWLQTF